MTARTTRIIDIQRGLHRQMPELGRIRTGEQVASSNGTRPSALGTFRFTSRNRDAIEAAAEQWGGTVVASPTLAGQIECITEAPEIDVVLPPADMAFSQAWEQWGKGFCVVRCDGERDVVNDQPCTCDPEAPKCKIHTRLSVMVPTLPGIGVWRVETQGFYAASELGATIDVIRSMAGRSLVPALLRLVPREQRTIRDGKPDVRKFTVLQLDLSTSLAEISHGGPALGAGAGGATWPAPGERALEDEPTSALAPAPAPIYSGHVRQEALKPAPMVSVRDQMAEVERGPKPKRKGSAPIAPTGVSPRPVSQVDAQVCSLCDQPYGTDALTKNPGAGSKFVHRACAEGMETPAEDSPASQGDGDGGRGGTSSGSRAPAPAEPAPTAEPRPPGQRAASAQQRKALFAAVSKVLPRQDDEPMADLEARRKDFVLDVAGICGQPGLVSRTDLWARTAGRLLDLLSAMQAGDVAWDPDAGDLLVVETGEVIREFEGAS